jgi:DNA-binding LacI/PurR family transcriptional regulator
LKALEEVGYYPNVHARALVAGKSTTIGIIVSNLENPFFVDTFRAIEDGARARGYDVLLSNTNYSSDQLLASVRLMLGRRVAGLAVVVSEMESTVLDELRRAGIRVVFYDVGKPGDNIYNVRFDYTKGMRQLVEYLYSLGHRRMAYVGSPMSLRSTDDRLESFLAETRTLSVESRCVVAPRGFSGGRDAARDLLRSGFDPTAILCVSDMRAIGVMRELRNQNISVPRDISVTGFDNITLAEFSCPSLTTIHIPRARIGHMMLQCLVPDDPELLVPGGEYVIDPGLVVRESTGAVRSHREAGVASA